MNDYIFVNTTDPEFGIDLGMRLLNVHLPADCQGRPCCTHAPSEHHMRTWPQNWRADRMLMERICEHGVGHPDPDDIAYHRSRGSTDTGVHGCDGCCHPKEES